jgi:ABC-2 type transport system permease protein
MTSITQSVPLNPAQAERPKSMPVLGQILMMTKRSLIIQFRSPGELLPSILIGVFFLFIYDSAFGGTAQFLPALRGVNYLAFILPLSVISGALNPPAGQQMVRDIKSGYFDKLLLTPINRSALLLGHILSSGVVIALQTALIVGVALLRGLESVTGGWGLLALIALAVVVGMGFSGFTVGIALRTGSPAAAQGASLIFFPLSFLTSAYFPLEYLDGWLQIAARLNPITYLLDATRAVLIEGWIWNDIWPGLIACVGLTVIPFLFALWSLYERSKQR